MAYSGDKKRTYQSAWIRARRQSWIEANGPCRSCGSNENLEVDHIDATQKKLPMSKVWSASAVRMQEELAKCQVLCVSCHKAKTLACNEKPRGESHGRSRLTDLDVIQIRERYATGGMTMDEVGAPYGMDRKNVWEIIHRQTWRHI